MEREKRGREPKERAGGGEGRRTTIKGKVTKKGRDGLEGDGGGNVGRL